MANHVTSFITVEFSSEEDLRKYTFDVMQYDVHMDIDKPYDEKLHLLCVNYLNHLVEGPFEHSATSFINNFGAKWLFFDDVDFDRNAMYIHMQSAWSPTIKLFQRMINDIMKHDEAATLTARWEDESFCFVGGAYFCKDGCDWDEYEPTSDEINMFEDPDVDVDEFYDNMINRVDEIIDSCKSNSQPAE
jgi:hypothetical protein